MKTVYNGAFDLEFDKRQMDETMDHSQLAHKEDPDQHPIDAITGLTEALAGQNAKIADIEDSVEEVERLGHDVDAKIAELNEYKEQAIAGIEVAEAAAVERFAEEVETALPDATATAVTLPTGTPATASVDYENDVLEFEFGLPAGIKGDRGFRGYRGPGVVDGTGSGISINPNEGDFSEYGIIYPWWIDGSYGDESDAAQLVVYSGLDYLTVGDIVKIDDMMYPIRLIAFLGLEPPEYTSYDIYEIGDPYTLFLDDPVSIKGADGQDGQDGQDYILTQQDIEDIADNVAEIIGNADDDEY